MDFTSFNRLGCADEEDLNSFIENILTSETNYTPLSNIPSTKTHFESMRVHNTYHEAGIHEPPSKKSKNETYDMATSNCLQKKVIFAEQKDGPSQKIQLLPTSIINKKYRSVFSDSFDSFNKIQSESMEDVYFNKSNIIISAPTGSGKTVIFELGMVQALQNRDNNFSIDSIAECKMIYMAPLKTLCSQRERDWTEKFKNVNVRCKCYTGDMSEDDLDDINKYDLLITTPEKWDSLTRRWKLNKPFFRSVKLLMIDEVHLINDNQRGATMEVVITRMKRIQQIEKLNIRIIAVSATIPNIQDLGIWLSNPIEYKGSQSYQTAIVKEFNETFRPVKLQVEILGYDSNGKSGFIFDRSLNYKLYDVFKKFCNKKPTLVFCNSRRGTEEAADALYNESMRHASYYFENMSMDAINYANNDFFSSFEQHHRAEILEHRTIDLNLKKCVRRGIAFHHAGLSPYDRKLVEEAFLENTIVVLFATSTLAVGVNLPAHTVIIKSTQMYDGNKYVEYPESNVQQMIGRAGRPQFDSTAQAIIMTELDKAEFYRTRIAGGQPTESCLHLNLHEHLNAEIMLKGVINLESGLMWLKSSFLYVRALKNPIRYGITCIKKALHGSNETEVNLLIDDYLLNTLLKTTIGSLLQSGLISTSEFGINEADAIISPISTDIIASKYPGKIMARYCLGHKTMNQIMQINKFSTIYDILVILGGLKEFEDVKLRKDEQAILNKLNKDKLNPLRFQHKGKSNTTSFKITTLIQTVLGNISLSNQSLVHEISGIMRTATRVICCLSEYLQQCTNHYELTKNVLVLQKCLKAKMWENSNLALKQLDKVGVQIVKHLAKINVFTIPDLLAANNNDLTRVLQRSAAFVIELKESAKLVPHFSMSVSFEKDVTINDDDNGIESYNKDEINTTAFSYDDRNIIYIKDPVTTHLNQGAFKPIFTNSILKVNVFLDNFECYNKSSLTTNERAHDLAYKRAISATLLVSNEYDEILYIASLAYCMSNKKYFSCQTHINPRTCGQSFKISIVHDYYIGVDYHIVSPIEYKEIASHDPLFTPEKDVYLADLEVYKDQAQATKKTGNKKGKLTINDRIVVNNSANIKGKRVKEKKQIKIDAYTDDGLNMANNIQTSTSITINQEDTEKRVSECDNYKGSTTYLYSPTRVVDLEFENNLNFEVSEADEGTERIRQFFLETKCNDQFEYEENQILSDINFDDWSFVDEVNACPTVIIKRTNIPYSNLHAPLMDSVSPTNQRLREYHNSTSALPQSLFDSP